MSKLYRGRFMIGIYALEHEGETCLAICENVREFARLMNIKESCARMILQHVYNGKYNRIKFEHKYRTLELIDMFL